MPVEQKYCLGCEQPFPFTLLKDNLCSACRQVQRQMAKDQGQGQGQPAEHKDTQPTLVRATAEERRAIMKANEAQLQAEADQREFNAKEEAVRELAKRELCRRRYLPFIMSFVPDYHAGWVHKDIAMRLEKFSDAVARKESPRLMLTMPPRHGKSQLTSKGFAPWHLGRHPTHEFIGCSYSGPLAMSFSRALRNIMRDPYYQRIFPGAVLDQDSQSVEQWNTTKGGGYTAAGIGGPITGKGAHILLIDDPIKNREEAESELNRERLWDWYTSTAYTRLAPGGGVIAIATRWHDDDPLGRLLAEQDNGGDPWELVNYPAIAEEDEPYRRKGEALHPERYDLAALNRIKRVIGPRDWSALYQQNPVAEDGSFFTKEMIHYYNPQDLPDLGSMLYYDVWDFAIGQKQYNDYTVGLKVGVDYNGCVWVLELLRGKWDALGIVDNLLSLQCRPRMKSMVVGLERGQIQLTMGPLLQKVREERKAYDFVIHECKPGKTDKVARARAVQGRMQQGMVKIPAGAPWTTTLVNELLRFPNGKNDDCVDVMAWLGQMLINMVALAPEKPKPKKSWRDKISTPTSHKSAMAS